MSSTSRITPVSLDYTESSQPLSLGLCLSFGIGTVGSAVLLNSVAVYFPTFMATVLGQSTAVAGLLITLSKLYDILADFAIGAASDRTRSRLGRRRPYLLMGALVSAISFPFIFNPPALSGVALLVFFAAMLMIYSTGYSLFVVPYLAMTAEMTQGYHDRTRLLSYRTLFAGVGQLVALSGTAVMIVKFGGGRIGYSRTSLALTALIVLTMLVTFLTTGNARSTPRLEGDKPPLAQQVRLAAQNRPLMLLLACKFFSLLALSAVSSMTLLFMLNATRYGYGGQRDLSLVQNVSLMLSMPLWLAVARRIGKRNTMLVGFVLYSATLLSWLATSGTEAEIWLWARGFVLGLGSGAILLSVTAMLPDVMEYDRRRTGLRREGTFSALYAIVEKSAYAVGSAVTGVFLSFAGYRPSTHGALVVQPHGAVTALYLGVSVIPAAFLMMGFVLILFYDLDERKLRAG